MPEVHDASFGTNEDWSSISGPMAYFGGSFQSPFTPWMQDSDRSDVFGIPDALVGFDGRLPPSQKSASHEVTVGKIGGPLGDDAQPFVGGEWHATDANRLGQAFTIPSEENGKMGFITPGPSDEPMTVVPEAWASGSVMPRVSTFACVDDGIMKILEPEKFHAHIIKMAVEKLSVAQVEFQREIEALKDDNVDKLLTADAEMKKKAMAELKEELDGNHLGHQDALKKLGTTYKDIQSSLARHNLDLKSALRDAIVLIAVSISGHSRPMLVSVIDADLKMDPNLRSQILNAYHHIFPTPDAFKSVSDQRAGWRGKRLRKRRQAPEDALAAEETSEANDTPVEGLVPTSQVRPEAPFMPTPGLELDICVMTDWIDQQKQDVIRFSF